VLENDRRAKPVEESQLKGKRTKINAIRRSRWKTRGQFEENKQNEGSKDAAQKKREPRRWNWRGTESQARAGSQKYREKILKQHDGEDAVR